MSRTPSFSTSESFQTTGEDKADDTTLSLNLGSLLDLLCNTRKATLEISRLPPDLGEKLDVPLEDFLKKHRYLVSAVQEFARVPFVVKQRLTRNTFKLLFDGRFLSSDLSTIFKPFLKNKPTWHILLDKEGQVEKCSKRRTSLPKSHTLPARLPDATFAELVLGKDGARERGCDFFEHDPQSQPETVRLLADWGFSHSVKVNFCVALLPVSVPVCWISPEPSDLVQPRNILCLEAFTGQGNRIRFRKEMPKTKRGRKKTERVDKVEEEIFQNPDRASEPNRASGMTVHLTGLSLAYKLGLLSKFKNYSGKQVLEHLNSDLSSAFGFIWLQRDNLGRVRYVTYCDGLLRYPHSFEIGPGPLDPTSEVGRKGPATVAEQNMKREEQCWQGWKKVFDYIWERREVATAHKTTSTLPLFDKWGSEKELVGGTHARCFWSLKNGLSKLRVFCFSQGDSSLHTTKLFFARYCEEVRKLKRGVHLRTVTGTKILCLQTSEVELENVSQFYDFGKPGPKLVKDDQDANALLLANKDWCEEQFGPNLSILVQPFFAAFNSDGLIEGYKRDLDNRGNLLVKKLADTHVAFVRWICKRFQLDLTTSPFLTLSSLSFRVALLDFWKKAGPTAQSLEKTKPHWEDSLRNLSKGGFSYSCRSHITSGNCLFKGYYECEKAKAVAEFDLKSCYGYSLSNMAVPGGFGVGYTADEKGCLRRTDRQNRANSFEYLGVQAIIRSALISYPAKKIIGVWSNFSPLGILYVGKYPVDLALVIEGTEVFLCQFDGQVNFEFFFCFSFVCHLHYCNSQCQKPKFCFSVRSRMSLGRVSLSPPLHRQSFRRRSAGGHQEEGRVFLVLDQTQQQQ
jgi:hypothetical protein